MKWELFDNHCTITFDLAGSDGQIRDLAGVRFDTKACTLPGNFSSLPPLALGLFATAFKVARLTYTPAVGRGALLGVAMGVGLVKNLKKQRTDHIIRNIDSKTVGVSDLPKRTLNLWKQPDRPYDHIKSKPVLYQPQTLLKEPYPSLHASHVALIRLYIYISIICPFKGPL